MANGDLKFKNPNFRYRTGDWGSNLAAPQKNLANVDYTQQVKGKAKEINKQQEIDVAKTNIINQLSAGIIDIGKNITSAQKAKDLQFKESETTKAILSAMTGEGDDAYNVFALEDKTKRFFGEWQDQKINFSEQFLEEFKDVATFNEFMSDPKNKYIKDLILKHPSHFNRPQGFGTDKGWTSFIKGDEYAQTDQIYDNSVAVQDNAMAYQNKRLNTEEDQIINNELLNMDLKV